MRLSTYYMVILSVFLSVAVYRFERLSNNEFIRLYFYLHKKNRIFKVGYITC